MSVPAFPFGDGSAVNPEPVRQLLPGQAGRDPGRFEPCGKGVGGGPKGSYPRNAMIFGTKRTCAAKWPFSQVLTVEV